MYNSVPDYNLFHNNTFAMRVKASEWIQFDSPDDLPVIFQKLEGRRWKVIGAGSNLLFTGDYDGILLHSSIKGITIGQPDSYGTIKVKIGSGETFDDVISCLASKGLWGAENLSGIPGQIGAGVIQNVGAYGVEIKDILDSAEAYDTVTNKMVAIDVNECKYAYRDSRFKHSPDRGRYIVTSATIRVSERPTPKLTYGSLDKLVPHDNPTPVEVREAVIATRRTKLPDVATSPSDFSISTDTSAPWPTAAGSAGSYFKNPRTRRNLSTYNCRLSPSQYPPLSHRQQSCQDSGCMAHRAIRIQGDAQRQCRSMVQAATHSGQPDRSRGTM